MTFSSRPCGVAAVSLTHASGSDMPSLWSALTNHRSGLKPNDLAWCDLECWIGSHPGIENITLPNRLANYSCRNNKLAWSALQDASLLTAIEREKRRFSPQRIGLIIGTSTSGIQSTEAAYAQRVNVGTWPQDFDFKHVHSVESLCQFVGKALGIAGPSLGVASACASSAKVFLIAQRWLATGVADAVLVGGADSLCLSTLHGFNALQLLSDGPCKPFDRNRNGISIAEAAGFALLTREQHQIMFLGGGESSDAHHITTPHPEGRGAVRAINTALKSVGLKASEIDYINAHGTATQSNDRAEAIALQHVFGDLGTPISSTKGTTGHTLGAAGITEAIITIETLRRQALPPFNVFKQSDEGVDLNFVKETRAATVRIAMTNNFGFGGTNCSLIFGREGLDV